MNNDSSKIMIVSTPNGMDLFYEIYKESQINNLYKIIETPYNVIEGRDEEWVSKTIKEIGSVEAFKQEFELDFKDKNILTINSVDQTEMYKTISKLEEKISKIEINNKNHFIVLCTKDVGCDYDESLRMSCGSVYNLEIRDKSYSFSWNKDNIHPMNSHSSCWFDNNSNPNINTVKDHYVVVDEMYMDILKKMKNEKKETYKNNITGDVVDYRIPSNADLTERIIKIESNIDRILSKLNIISDYEKASKIEIKPNKVTQEDVNLYKDRLMNYNYYSGTQSSI
jgi:hypothetical protein